MWLSNFMKKIHIICWSKEKIKTVPQQHCFDLTWNLNGGTEMLSENVTEIYFFYWKFEEISLNSKSFHFCQQEFLNFANLKNRLKLKQPTKKLFWFEMKFEWWYGNAFGKCCRDLLFLLKVWRNFSQFEKFSFLPTKISEFWKFEKSIIPQTY